MAKNKEIKKVENKLINLIENTEITKTNCKLCQSEFREKAEETFETSNSFKAAERFLSDKGEQISYLSIRNHLTKHYLGTQRINSVKEYLEEINNFSVGKYDHKDNLHFRISALRREFLLISAGTDDEAKSVDERRRSADILKKLSDGISGLEDKIDEIDNDLRSIEILVENLQALFADAIKKTSSEEAKRALMDILNKLADNMSEMLVEQK